MSANIAIRVKNLGKRYRIGAHRQADSSSFLGTLSDIALSPFDYLRNTLRPPTEDEILWAVKDISFDILQGEVVGIVGRNGAGKSTLLKLLARTTEPTTGHAEVYGRIAALLEIGTGFHPDLTGRENIYVNGAILGMSKREIDRRFDEIVAFAELEPFIDTPVKRYSSGMSVRLAFSVSAHLLSDILVIDEVLAVGDIAFQRKCLGKMDDVSKAGRTILFVSHNMPTVSRLCNRTILLDKGKIVSDGVTSDVIKEYLKIGMQGAPLRTWLDLSAAPGNDIVRLCSVRIITESGHTESIVDIRKPVGVEITYRVLKPGHRLFPDIRLFNAENIIAFASFDNKSKWWNESRDVGLYTSIVWIPGNLLSEGNFSIAASIDEGNLSIAIQNEAVSFEVSDPMEGDSVRGDYTGTYSGVVRPELEWETRFQKS